VVIYQVPAETVVVSYTVFITVGRAGSPAVSSSSFIIEAGTSQAPTYWIAIPYTITVTVRRSVPPSKKPLRLVGTGEDKVGLLVRMSQRGARGYLP
jgi:hypothetical protein